MPTDLKVQTFDGVPLGSNTDFEPQEIPQGFARNIIDAWVDSPGLIRQRGPIQPLLPIASNTFPTGSDPLGVVQTKDPSGNTVIAVFYSYDTSTKVRFYNSTGVAGTTEYSFPTFISGGYNILTNSSPAIGGGALIGISLNDYTPNGLGEWLFLWKGGGTGETFMDNCAWTTGNAFVETTGNYTTSGVTPGMFFRGVTNATPTDSFTPVIGVVKKIHGPTLLELESPALWSPGGDGTPQGIFTPFVGLTNRSSTGLITVAAGSDAVVGTDTKFVSQNFAPTDPPANDYYIYRKRDLKFVGRVASVTNEVSLSLAAVVPAGADMSADEYVAIDRKSFHTLTLYDDNYPKVGHITAIYADRQWYANLGLVPSNRNTYTNRLWFSEQDDPEALDLSQNDGNFINIDSKNNDPIVGLFALRSALLIFTHNEVFTLTGTNPNQFRVSRLSDDGALGGMSIVDFHGGVVWAGRRGIYIYDGIKYQNLLAQRYSKQWLEVYDSGLPVTNMRVFRVKDKIIVQARGLALTQTIIKGTDTETRKVAVVIDIPSNSVVFFTNCAFFGMVGWQNHNYALVKSSTENKVNFVNLDTLFSQTVSGASLSTDELDLFHGDSADSKGPRFFLETARYSMGQLLQMKTWKRLLVHYFSTGPLKCDLVTGIIPFWPATKTITLPDSGYTWDTLAEDFETWDVVATFNPSWDTLAAGRPLVKRFKFLQRSQLIGLRFYPAEDRENSVQIASWALGFKWMRPGRV